jgi:hypothetical protein
MSAPIPLIEGQDVIIAQPNPLEYGLSAYDSLANTKDTHPVETVQKNHFKRDQELKHNMAYHIYGKHFMQGLKYEQMAIGKLHSQGIGRSQHSLEVSMGIHNTIRPEDVMNLPQHQGYLGRQSKHVIMQQRAEAIGQ